MSDGLQILPVHGLPDFRPGDDLTGAILTATDPLQDGDIVVVTSKIVSKVEGRLIPTGADPAKREELRQRAIDDETVRVVARRGRMRIVQTRQGLVMTAAGVDASNVHTDEIALLPVDPDASAARLRDEIKQHTGKTVAVIVTDTSGRVWRTGQTDMAIGVAGISAMHDYRGSVDPDGNELAVTEVAIADEIAAATDLVKGKLDGVPVAIVRGLRYDDDGRGAAPLVRATDYDMFSMGTAEARELGRREFAEAAGVSAAHSALHADADRVATLYAPTDRGKVGIREGFLGLLSARPDATSRQCVPGHITASAIVIDPTRDAVLLNLHPRAGCWITVGGHCEEEDASIVEVAAREAHEETGIDGLAVGERAIALDIHPITCSLGVSTRHYDITYAAVAPAGAMPTITDESLALEWFPRHELPDNVGVEIPDLISLAYDYYADPKWRAQTPLTDR